MQKDNNKSMEKENIWFYYISVGFIAIIMGYIITQKMYDAFLCIPLFITPLLYGYIRQWAALTIISNYVSFIFRSIKFINILD